MNRYQFEDLISDYIENNITIKKRKEFEEYLNSNPDSKKQVELVRNTMNAMTSLTPVTVSKTFMDGLNKKIELKKNKPEKSADMGKSYFGFSPVYAGLFSVSFLGFIWMGFQLLPQKNNGQIMSPLNNSQQVVLQRPNTLPLLTPSKTSDQFSTSGKKDELDSSNVKDKSIRKPTSIDNNATFVKDQ